MAGWRNLLRSVSPDIVGRALRRGGGIAKRGSGVALRGGGLAKRGMGAALKTGGRAAKQVGGRTNLLEELGRVEAEPSNRNRRAEISRVHGELNRGYKHGKRVKK
jgi:hypothetical protein